MKIEHALGASPQQGFAGRSGDQLETAFLAEMLKIAMPKPIEGLFGGGAGESHFTSFQTDQYAAALASRVDLGLSSEGEVHNGRP